MLNEEPLSVTVMYNVHVSNCMRFRATTVLYNEHHHLFHAYVTTKLI
jgi:hypothetical protein